MRMGISSSRILLVMVSSGAMRELPGFHTGSALRRRYFEVEGRAMNVLFVGAPPDDIELFCGGTAALYAKQGNNVFFCVSTNGNVGSATLPPAEIAAIRHQEASNAAAVIGAKLIWLNFEDEFLFDTRETRHAFIEAFRQSQPEVVICHW